MSVLDVGELEGETRRLEVCWVVSNVMKKLSTATDSLLYSPRIDFGPGLNWGAKGYLLTTDRKTHKDQSQHNSEAPERKLNGVEVYVGISVINCFAPETLCGSLQIAGDVKVMATPDGEFRKAFADTKKCVVSKRLSKSLKDIEAFIQADGSIKIRIEIGYQTPTRGKGVPFVDLPVPLHMRPGNRFGLDACSVFGEFSE